MFWSAKNLVEFFSYQSLLLCTIVPNNCINIIKLGNHDYESGPFNFVIPAGETRVPVSILITTGRYFEQNELFTVTIDSSSLHERVFVEPGCLLVVTLVNDDGKLCCTSEST